MPQTLGEHLKKRRRDLGLLQREVAERMGIDLFTYINWEKDKTRPADAKFRVLIAFLGYDPSRPPATLAERLAAKRRTLGATLDQISQYLGWDPGSLNRYVSGVWRMKPDRVAALEAFLTADAADLVDAILRFPRRRR